MIYADNAATTRISEGALRVMTTLAAECWGNPSSLYVHGQKAKEVLEEARAEVAAIIGANPREIIFTSGGSEADNQAIRTAAELGRKAGKKHIISTAFEHHAVLHTLAALEKEGFEVTLLDVHENGIVKASEVEAAIREDTCLVTVMAANNEIGTIQPFREIGAVCRKKNVLFHVDAVQAVGHIPIDVREMGVDFLSASAHKFNGPKGIGFLYVRKGQKLRSLLDGGQQENGFRAGTENVASIVGMATALKINCARMEEASSHLEELTLCLRMGIERFYDNPVFLGSGVGSQLPGFTSVSFPGHPAEGLMHMLDLKGIAVSTGAACDSKNTQISHVLKAVNATNEIARSTIRITFGPENTVADVDALLAALKRILRAGGK